MQVSKTISTRLIPIIFAFIILSAPVIRAHCDGLDGPVIKDARIALEKGNVKIVLKWVKSEYEKEITEAFNKTLSVRKLSKDSKDLADMYFFETLVRIHRAGEGAAYTGLKPAGRDLGPAIPKADKVVETGAPQDLVKFLQEYVHDGLHPLYLNLMKKKDFNPDDVEAGREFVKAYVEFVHYVEKIYLAGMQTGNDGPAKHEH